MIDKLGRKFIFSLIVLIIGIVIQVVTTNGMTETFMYFLLSMIGIYCGGNGIEHISKAVSTKATRKPRTQLEMEYKLKDLFTKFEPLAKGLKYNNEMNDAILLNVQDTNKALATLIQFLQRNKQHDK